MVVWTPVWPTFGDAVFADRVRGRNGVFPLVASLIYSSGLRLLQAIQLGKQLAIV